MKTSVFCLGVALISFAFGAAAKEAAPNGISISKPYVDMGKRERRSAAPDSMNQSDGWQPYLRWHRDATSLQGSNNRPDALGRVFPATQL